MWVPFYHVSVQNTSTTWVGRDFSSVRVSSGGNWTGSVVEWVTRVKLKKNSLSLFYTNQEELTSCRQTGLINSGSTTPVNSFVPVNPRPESIPTTFLRPRESSTYPSTLLTVEIKLHYIFYRKLWFYQDSFTLIILCLYSPMFITFYCLETGDTTVSLN